MTTIMDELTNTISDLATLTKKQSYAYAMNEDIELLLSETTDINNTAQELINYITYQGETYQDENNPAQLEIWEKNAIFFLQNVIDNNVSKDDNNIDNLSSYIMYVIQELYNLTRAALKIKKMQSIGTVVEPRVIEEITDAEDSRKRRRQQGSIISLPDTSAPDTRNGGMATRKKRKKKYRKHNKTKPKRYNKQIKHYTKKYRKHY